MSGDTDGAMRWLAPILPGMPGVMELDVARLRRFEMTLRRLLAKCPVDAGVPQGERSVRLAQIRRDLAASGQLADAVPAADGGAGRAAVLQAPLQFVCGYHDVDLRDSTGLGHGRLIARHGSAPDRARWLPSLLAGDLAGIAITEAHGGSQVHATTTAATAHDGCWTLTGTKTWISRLREAALFIVFFADPAGRLTVGVVDAAADGLHRRVAVPAGLSGWAWGELRLEEVRLRPCDVLGRPGDGMDLLREHFAYYRPLVAATALGAAANVHDRVTRHLRARRQAGAIIDLRDNALITLGSTHAQINAARLAALTAQRLALAGDQRAELWGCGAKAHGVDTAYAAVSDLALLVGAAGFTAGSPLVKAVGDLAALRYADGIHDSLYRAAGRALTIAAAAPSMIPLHGPCRQASSLLHA
ncbi:MAG: acyl-CoA dehydrogenase family protein [Streptosporangiaceae bacterium]